MFEKSQENTEEQSSRRLERKRKRAEKKQARKELAYQVEVAEETRTAEAELVDEIAADVLGAPEPTATPSAVPEDKIDISRDSLSEEAKPYLDGFETYANGLKETFGADLKKVLMDSRINMYEKGEMIHEATTEHYNLFIDKIGVQFQRELAQQDRAGGDHEEMLDRFMRLTQISEAIAEDYDSTVRILVRVSGSQSGADEHIDAGSEWDELNEFNRNGRELIEKMSLPDDLIARAMANPDYEPDDFQIETMGGICAESTGIIEKIYGGTPLTPDDYNTVLEGIEGFFEHEFDTTNMSSLEVSMRAVEDTGMMTTVYSMNQAQRYELGQTLIEKYGANETQARGGIQFLTAVGALDIGQAQTLIREGINGYAIFDSEEVEEIQRVRDELEELREHCAKSMKEGLGGNLAIEDFTASNLLLYELVFRFAALGAVLPFVFNIKDPQNWDQIVTNPFWIGCVAVSGITLDHVTGGIGSGSTSRLLAGIGAEDEDPDQARERYAWGGFCRVAGDHYETQEYLLETNPEVLAGVIEMATDPDVVENAADYDFSFDEFVDYQLGIEVERLVGNDPSLENPEEVALENLANRYGAELDSDEPSGLKAPTAMEGIGPISDQLFRVMGVQTVAEAQDIFDESDERRGLTSSTD